MPNDLVSSSAQQPIVEAIWREKYRLPDSNQHPPEQSPADSHRRVCAGIFRDDPKRGIVEPEAIAAMIRQEWCPGGRIHAGAGTGKRVTLINCFVNMTVDDSLSGIMAANTRAALTMQQGGGIGTDFSPIRPSGAVVSQTGSVASGPLSFMEIWNAMCGTIMSGGSRRGAMMGTLADNHPDLPDFITAKRQAGRLTNFNVSVLISDAFMAAVEANSAWDLGFPVPPADPEQLVDTLQRDGKPWYVYRRLPARELWDAIIHNTYDWAEPGVIFIDRVNALNNLAYAETIRCTNPCGEQPLPPNGDCNLGCVNLATLVRDPFTAQAQFDFERLDQIAQIGMRFLDNVVDVSRYPLPEQEREARDKRRTGLGIMGLGNALQMLRLRYGSPEALDMTGRIMERLRDSAYRASIDLARERGPFPLYDRDRYLDRPFVRSLPVDIRERLAQDGIRNGVLLTIAPTGTTAIYYNNVSSGLEPTFGWRYFRKVLQPDGSQREFAVLDAGFDAYCRHHGLDPNTASTAALPDYMVTALELSVEDHVKTQAVCQAYVDASVSKTINCPADISFENFREVYSLAYRLGTKGCTTYRPSGVRGAVLSTVSENIAPPPPASLQPMPRPDELEGRTYKVKWPVTDENLYVTVNDIIDQGRRRPFEIFIASRSAEHAELMSALTMTLSAVMRRSENPAFLVEDLERVRGAQGAWVNGRYYNGVVPLIASVMRRHLEKLGLMDHQDGGAEENSPASLGQLCPKCNSPTLYHQEGCRKCASCGYSTCG